VKHDEEVMMPGFTKMYWRPSQVPGWTLVVLAIAALLALGIAESVLKREPVVENNYDLMVAASRKVRSAIEVIRPIRGSIEPINPQTDPQRSGLIGLASSSVTSTRGGLESKQTTVNPNWAAVVVKMLLDAGVSEGDVVAVALSGSFPAINLAVYSAIETLGAEPIVIVSGSSSQWGANVPGMLWMDIERELRNAGVFRIKPVAASIGGIEDRGGGLPSEGVASIRRSIERADIELLAPANYREAVADRIVIYREYANGRPIRAFVNVGGGAPIVGPPGVDRHFAAGLSRTAPPRAFAVDTVMGYFLRENVPVVHLIRFTSLAERHGLPIAPQERVPVGSGAIYTARVYRRGMAAGLALSLIAFTFLVIHSAGVTTLLPRTGNGNRSMKPMV
jgi:poly-gamma-glutamate system protein